MRVLLVLCALATFAHAGPREAAEARRRVDEGNKLYEAGHYEDALRLYLAAYDLDPIADTQFNVGLAHEKMLNFEQCAIAFRRYLAEGSDPAVKERATERAKRCVERAHVPVKISSSPPGAAISLATASEAASFRGRTPTQLDLAPGSYRVKVEMSGFVPMEQSVQVEVGARPDIDFPLEKLSSLAIEAEPAGASVQIDSAAAEPTPFRRELHAGSYKLKLHKDGYRDLERDVTLVPGDQQTLVLTLTELPAVRNLAVRIAPAGELLIDGHRAAGQVQLVAGEVHVEANAPGRIPFSGDIAIPRDKGQLLDVDLTPTRPLWNKLTLGGLAGVTAGALLAGAIYGYNAVQDEHDYNRMPSLALADRGESSAHRSDFLFGLSVTAAIATGITWWWTRPRPSHVEVR
jgi:hypothetical protein